MQISMRKFQILCYLKLLPLDYTPNKDIYYYILDWVTDNSNNDRELKKVIDGCIPSKYSSEALAVLKVAILCTKATAALRPTMSQTLKMLKGKLSIKNFQKYSPSSSNSNPITSQHFWSTDGEIRPVLDDESDSIIQE
ncbi:hypothetical protein QVD17_26087 [Tagetes erecta]|uniref:Uncharacterized protein n=1 Tax=Tagetes erecta TaxID=13708 RepID=A0AAD8KA96_TARER|nr:hypothetical protein QVD17_26087 [Tagetes erecta]